MKKELNAKKKNRTKIIYYSDLKIINNEQDI